MIRRLYRLPDGFAELLPESEASGYRFVRRVFDEWEGGVYRSDRPGEALVGAMADCTHVLDLA